MFELLNKYCHENFMDPPDENEVLRNIRTKPNAYKRLLNASQENRMLIQPRCGVGRHEAMLDLHRVLCNRSKPDMLSLTVDAHTRLLKLDKVNKILLENPENLNGYPLINHGWKLARELVDSVDLPIEVRHGSPDGRLLFETTIAAGITSFEGGGLGYNIPYCRDVKLSDSLHYWKDVDAQCGYLAKNGVIIDREFFGTMTGVLMPPSISIAMSLLEAMLAAEQGVISLSPAICQCGNPIQDIAALKALSLLAKEYLPKECKVFPVFHEFMGVFPRERSNADALILLGSLVAKRGGAAKLINKSYQEALGVPTAYVNADGISTADSGRSGVFDCLLFDDDLINQEMEIICKEVRAQINVVLEFPSMIEGIETSFAKGLLDVPFSASRSANSEVMPMRDPNGFIRIKNFGSLAICDEAKRFNNRKLESGIDKTGTNYQKVMQDIFYFSNLDTKNTKEENYA